LSTLSGMKYYKTSKAGGSFPLDQEGSIREIYLDTYLKIGDELRVEGAKVEIIKYGFWKGKFCEVTITTKGFKNWVSLKKAVLGKFGEGKVARFPYYPGFEGGGEEVEWHIWLGKITEMELLYNENSQITELWMESTVFREKAFKKVEQEQRGGKK